MTRVLSMVGLSICCIVTPGFAQQPKKKSPPPTRFDEEFARFRALDAKDRLSKVEKFVPGKDAFSQVEKGNLETMIVERGTVEPVGAASVVCLVKGRSKDSVATTIKWLIDDGAIVKKGDKLVTLDDSALQDHLKSAMIKSEGAEAAVAKAKSSLDSIKREAVLGIRLAELDLKFAQAELKDGAAGKNKEVLELKVERSRIQLELAQSRSKSQIDEATGVLAAQMKSFDSSKRVVDEIESEIKHCTLFAPLDGLATYFAAEMSRFGRGGDLVEVGAQVREGQRLLRVFDMKKFAIATKVHEAVVSTVRIGQATLIQVDAFPGTLMKGKVKSVASVASQVDWARSDVKVYAVEIAIEEPSIGLKPGMSAEVRIQTGERKDVLKVPTSAILNVGGDRVCYVRSGQELLERRVLTRTIGLNATEIVEGLKEGENVLTDLRSILTPKTNR